MCKYIHTRRRVRARARSRTHTWSGTERTKKTWLKHSQRKWWNQFLICDLGCACFIGYFCIHMQMLCTYCSSVIRLLPLALSLSSVCCLVFLCMCFYTVHTYTDIVVPCLSLHFTSGLGTLIFAAEFLFTNSRYIWNLFAKLDVC